MNVSKIAWRGHASELCRSAGQMRQSSVELYRSIKAAYPYARVYDAQLLKHDRHIPFVWNDLCRATDAAKSPVLGLRAPQVCPNSHGYVTSNPHGRVDRSHFGSSSEPRIGKLAD